MIESTIMKEMPLLAIDLGIGIVGFVSSLGWGRSTKRKMDRDTVMFLAKVWIGIALFGMALAFIL